MTAIIYSFAAERAKRRPNERTSVSAWGPNFDPATLPVAPHCPVCKSVPGVQCCEYGRNR
jgi:hypothetical protein